MARSALYRFASSARSSKASSASASNVTQQNIDAIIRLEHDAFTQRTFGERVADAVTRVATKPSVIAAHALVLGMWMLGNTLGSWQFDPAPFFVLCTVLAIEAMFLTMLVLVSQQRLTRISDRRSHLNLQIDVLAEQEMTLMVQMLERLFEHLKLEPVSSPPQSRESGEMNTTTDLGALVNKLDRTLEEREKNK